MDGSCSLGWRRCVSVSFPPRDVVFSSAEKDCYLSGLIVEYDLLSIGAPFRPCVCFVVKTQVMQFGSLISPVIDRSPHFA